MSKDKTVPPDSEFCANPKCGHLYHKGPCPFVRWFDGGQNIGNAISCPCASYVPPAPQTANFMRQVPGSLACVRCEWKVPQGLSPDEENKALHKHLDAAHPNWQSDGITKSLHAELPATPPQAMQDGHHTLAPSLEEMKAAVKAVYPKATTFFANEGPNSHWRMRDAAMNEIDRVYCGAMRGDAPIWEQVYAKLPAQPGDGADADKPPMPAHDYAKQWARDTLSGKIGGRFEWGERNLAKCYLELSRQASRSREDGWVSVAERLPDSAGPWLVSKGAGKVAPRRTCLTAMTTYGSGRLHFPPSVTHWQPLPTPPKEGGKA